MLHATFPPFAEENQDSVETRQAARCGASVDTWTEDEHVEREQARGGTISNTRRKGDLDTSHAIREFPRMTRYHQTHQHGRTNHIINNRPLIPESQCTKWRRNRYFESISFTYSQVRFVCVASFSIIAILSQKKFRSNPIQSRIQIRSRPDESKTNADRGRRGGRRMRKKKRGIRTHAAAAIYTQGAAIDLGSSSSIFPKQPTFKTSSSHVRTHYAESKRQNTQQKATRIPPTTQQGPKGGRQTDKLDKEREKSLEKKNMEETKKSQP